MTLKRFFVSALMAFSIIGATFWGCGTEVVESPEPGVLRIKIKPDNDQSFLVQGADSFSVFTWYTLQFGMGFGQAAAYTGEKFAYIYETRNSAAREDVFINLYEMTFSRSDMNYWRKLWASNELDLTEIEPEAKREYVEQTAAYNLGEVAAGDLTAPFTEQVIFESYLPPGDYDSLQIGVFVPPSGHPWRNVVITDPVKGDLVVPLDLPEGEGTRMYFPVEFTIVENGVTEILFGARPADAVSRYRDSWIVDRETAIKIVEVREP
jgi:hypothetical protein